MAMISVFLDCSVYILGNPDMPHSVPTACSGMGHACVTEDASNIVMCKRKHFFSIYKIILVFDIQVKRQHSNFQAIMVISLLKLQ